jgi:hypothetical protein
VRVNDGHHLSALISEPLLHGCRVGEEAAVPCEVALAVGVFNVQPNNVNRNVVLVELGVNRVHVCFVPIVPAALVITQREHRRERLSSS